MTVTAGGKAVQIAKGMYLLSGQKLAIDMEPPIGATIDATDALPYATRFDYLVARESVQVSVSVPYGTGNTKQASVRLSARGRWI